jgi:ABC-type dipeptide/oligopeptide/nickel transport system permease component
VTGLIGRRVAIGCVTLFVTSVVVFLIIHLIPGDPVAVLLQNNGSPAVRRMLLAYYGLNRPLPSQYLHWLGQVVQLNFGHDIFTGQSVGPLLFQRFERTLYLMLGGLLIALVIAIPTALWAASRKGGVTDVALTSGALGLQSIPEFWLGTLLVLIFAVKLGWLPTAGYVAPSQSVSGFFEHAILPMVTVGAILTGLLVRTLRASLVEQLRQDYVTTALSQAVPRWRVVSVHALRNALIPTLTIIGLMVGLLLGGTIITETVFSYPGMGEQLVNAISNRDYPLVQAGLLLFAGSFILVNVVTDVLVIMLEPRNRRAVSSA